MTDKEKILAEIERRKKEAYGNEWGWAVQCATYDEIISFINSLPEEPVCKEYTFKSIPRLLDMIQPSDRAKFYTSKLADSLDEQGYHTDANIVRESIKIMNGEKVAMSTMDEEPVSEDLEEFITVKYNGLVGIHGEFDKTYIDGTAKAIAIECGVAGAQWQKGKIPHWKKGNLPNTPFGINGDYLTCPDGYYIELTELLKLPKE